MTKKELRQEYLQKRLDLTEEERIEKNEMLLQHFLKIPLPQINHAMSYIAFSQKKEVVPTAIEIWLKQQHPESLLCYPKTDLNEFTMEAVAQVNTGAITPGMAGIVEPVSAQVIDPLLIDVILVPLLVIDQKGYRVGYGKGFYDRFIPRCHAGVITIGLSYFEPIAAIEDVEEYDVPLKYCVTPEKLWAF